MWRLSKYSKKKRNLIVFSFIALTLCLIYIKFFVIGFYAPTNLVSISELKVSSMREDTNRIYMEKLTYKLSIKGLHAGLVLKSSHEIDFANARGIKVRYGLKNPFKPLESQDLLLSGPTYFYETSAVYLLGPNVKDLIKLDKAELSYETTDNLLNFYSDLKTSKLTGNKMILFLSLSILLMILVSLKQQVDKREIRDYFEPSKVKVLAKVPLSTHASTSYNRYYLLALLNEKSIVEYRFLHQNARAIDEILLKEEEEKRVSYKEIKQALKEIYVESENRYSVHKSMKPDYFLVSYLLFSIFYFGLGYLFISTI